MEDYYQVLQVEPTATIQEIRKAYRTLSLKYHPDRAGDSESAAEMFQLITKALDTLIDPAKKKVHDDFYQANVLRKRRFMEMDAKRQELKQKLEKGEMEAKKPKFGNDLDRLRDAGKQAMLAREQQQRQSLAVKISKAQEIQAARKSVEECSVQDCTLKYLAISDSRKRDFELFWIEEPDLGPVRIVVGEMEPEVQAFYGTSLGKGKEYEEITLKRLQKAEQDKKAFLE